MSFTSIPVLEIFIPFVTFGIIILCCTAFCKALHRAREENQREEQRDRPSVYVIPFPRLSHDREDVHRPPRYSVSTEDPHRPPPPYHEVQMKPDVFSPPECPPPAYSEYSHSSHFSSAPPQPHMDQPPPHQQP